MWRQHSSGDVDFRRNAAQDHGLARSSSPSWQWRQLITIAACLFDTLNVDVGVAKAFGMSESGIKHKNLALVGNDSGCLLTACAVSFAQLRTRPPAARATCARPGGMARPLRPPVETTLVYWWCCAANHSATSATRAAWRRRKELVTANQKLLQSEAADADVSRLLAPSIVAMQARPTLCATKFSSRPKSLVTGQASSPLCTTEIRVSGSGMRCC